MSGSISIKKIFIGSVLITLMLAALTVSSLLRASRMQTATAASHESDGL